MTENWNGISSEWRRLLRMRTNPVAVKLSRTSEELSASVRPSGKVSVCQMVKAAAHAGWQLACSPEQMGCFTAQMVLGFRAPSDGDVAHHVKQFVDDTDTAARLVENKPKLPVGDCVALLVGPLAEGFDPDVVVFLVDGLQAMGLLQACAHVAGENIATLNGMSSAVCAYGIVAPFGSGRPNLAVPCVGSRRYGAFQDHELIFTLPAGMARDILERALQMERSKKWPIPLVNAFLSPTIPLNYLVKPPTAS